jgi:hypothetical protein
MRRPPGRVGPIFSPSPNDWISRLGERHRAFAALAVTVEEQRRLDAWLIERFVGATLQLEQVDPARLTNALREVVMWVNSEGRKARLTPEWLIGLGGAGLRTRDDPADRAGGDMPAAHLGRAVETACDWFAAESFAELNPIEQAAIVLLRLTALRPFEQASQATALAAASLFTLRANLPPVIIKPQVQTAFRQAMSGADQMNLQPLVELMADAVISTLDEMIGLVTQARGERG